MNITLNYITKERSYTSARLLIRSRVSQTFWKGQIVNTVRSIGHMVSVATIQFSFCSVKEARDNTQMNKCSCFPANLYLPKQAGRIRPTKYAALN